MTLIDRIEAAGPRKPSEATLRMAKILGCQWVPKPASLKAQEKQA